MLLGYLHETSSCNKTISFFLLTLQKHMTNADKYMIWLIDTVEETNNTAGEMDDARRIPQAAQQTEPPNL